MRFIRVGRANERRLRLIFNFFPGPETALLRQCQLEQKSQLRSFSISIARGIREIFEIFEKVWKRNDDEGDDCRTREKLERANRRKSCQNINC